jgi:hypothetical protein
MEEKPKRKALKEYYLYKQRFLPFFLGSLAFGLVHPVLLALFIGMIIPRVLTVNTILFLLVFTVVSIVITFVVHAKTRLAIHEDGLEYHHWFTHVFSPWDQLTHFGVEVVNNSEDGGTRTVYNLHWIGQNRQSLKIDSIFPLRSHYTTSHTLLDVKHLLSTPIGQDLLHYAPHVIEEAQAKIDQYLPPWFQDLNAHNVGKGK